MTRAEMSEANIQENLRLRRSSLEHRLHRLEGRARHKAHTTLRTSQVVFGVALAALLTVALIAVFRRPRKAVS